MSLKKGLGKGLGALIASKEAEEAAVDIDKSSVTEIDINKVEPNKDQPRKYFHEEALKELADSISQYGIVQPLIVKNEGDYYSIVAGERRWRAARIAKLKKVPVIIKDYTASEILQIALIENVQRKDLNPIEEAVCYRRLIDEFFFTQEDISEKVGRSRSSIANSLRLLSLDKRVQELILEEKISESQARTLLVLTDKDLQFEIAEKIIDEQLSVREASTYIKSTLKNAKKPQPEKAKEITVTTYKTIESDLKTILGTKVNIKEKNDKGKIEIEYYSHDELDRLLLMFKNLENNT